MIETSRYYAQKWAEEKISSMMSHLSNEVGSSTEIASVSEAYHQNMSNETPISESRAINRNFVVSQANRYDLGKDHLVNDSASKEAKALISSSSNKVASDEMQMNTRHQAEKESIELQVDPNKRSTVNTAKHLTSRFGKLFKNED